MTLGLSFHSLPDPPHLHIYQSGRCSLVEQWQGQEAAWKIGQQGLFKEKNAQRKKTTMITEIEVLAKRLIALQAPYVSLVLLVDIIHHTYYNKFYFLSLYFYCFVFFIVSSRVPDLMKVFVYLFV